MKRTYRIAFIAFLTGITQLQAQESTTPDTGKLKEVYLREINIVGRNSRSDYHQLPEVVGTSIFAGKKNALIVMDNVNGNVVTNTMRQIVAKVPGIHVWESDGSGIQIGIAARGLSANRSWEFNLRQNGYDIAADPFGYPEAYYTPQLQAVQRIQIVRGAGSLQYGPQFGGMVNFVLRDGSDINKPFQFETQNTVGSFGLINTYNAIGGETSKFHYYAFFDHRNADGWRDNSRYNVNTGFASMSYKVTEKFKLGVEYMRWDARSQQPGGLTDAQFRENDQQSFRSRNWFDLSWNTGAVTADYYFKENNRLSFKAFTVIGDRNSVGYLRPINIKDSINPATGDFNSRIVDIDQYRNWGAELRYLADYKLLGGRQTFSGGLRYYRGHTDRFRNGKGTTGNDYDISIEGQYPTDLNFVTSNVAAFVENIFRINDRLILIPGVRVEHIRNEVDGRLSFDGAGQPVAASAENRKRTFLLAGVGAEYHIGSTEIYANASQSYRPVLFSDLTGNPTTEVIDQNLKDSKGYNLDLGYRGKVKDYLTFDISAYLLQYNDRIGTIAQQDNSGAFYNLRTNVGDSRSQGIEAFVEFNPIRAWHRTSTWGSFSLFASSGFTDARYEAVRVVSKQGDELVETSLEGKRVENAPRHIHRLGLNYFFKGLTFTAQWSYVSDAFADANNTVAPSANGQNGLIPSYSIGDISLNWKFKQNYNIRAGINNITDESYFTRRAGGYPGPGLMPADGRNFFLSFGVKL